MTLERSLIKIRKKVGPKIESWETLYELFKKRPVWIKISDVLLKV